MTAEQKPPSLIKIESQQEWHSALREIERSGLCGLILTTTGPDPLIHKIRLVSLAVPDNAIYFADCHELGEWTLRDLAALLEDASIKKVLYDSKTDISFLRVDQDRKIESTGVFDLMLASQICWSGYYYLTASNSPKNPWKKKMPDHSLSSLAERHLGILLNSNKNGMNADFGCYASGKAAEKAADHDAHHAADDSAYDPESNADPNPNPDQDASNLTSHLIRSAAPEAEVLLPLHSILSRLIAMNDLQRIADLEFSAAPSLAEMEITGICFDSQKAEEMVREKENEICELVWTMQDEALKHGFVTLSHDGKRLCCYINPDRQEDVISYLKKRGFPVTSTKAEVLMGLAAAGCAFAEALVRYRHACHTLDFLNKWLEHVHPADGRVHPRYFQIPASTGRISSKNPNAQQIPRAGDDAPALRKLFLPAKGKRFIKADFSAIELRIMAYLSKDTAMQEAFQEGVDLHSLTAAKICGISADQVTPPQRQAAKIMNFLLIYGGSARTLQWRALSDLGIFMPLDEAEQAKEKFFEAYEGVRIWQEQQLSQMSYTVPHHFHNCVQEFFSLPLTATFTPCGRRRIWPRFGTGIRASRFQLFNTPCQGTGADLIKLVMAGVYHKISCQQARMVGSVHDEILLEVPLERAEECSRVLQEIMERIGSNLLNPVPARAESEALASLAG